MSMDHREDEAPPTTSRASLGKEVIQEENDSLREEIKRAIAPINIVLDEYNEKLRSHENELGELDTRMVTMEANYKELSNRYEKLLRKTDDMENRTRRCNLRILGVPEGLEQGNPTKFVAGLLYEILGGGPNGLEKPPVLDRAHRALGPLPPEGGRPRPFIVCAHYYQEKERIQRLAREKGRLEFRGKQLLIFPDYNEKLRSHENELGELDTRMVTMEANYKELSNRYEKLLRKTDDMENRTRRCNLRILGVPEGLEQGNPTKFVAGLLYEILGGGPNGLEKPPVLDRAHRALGPLPPEGGRPRPFIVCAHYYQEKERIQRLAREKGRLEFRGKQLLIFPDYRADLARCRAVVMRGSTRNPRDPRIKQKHGPSEPGPSCESLRSDMSMGLPYNFTKEKLYEPGPEVRGQLHQTQLDSIFKVSSGGRHLHFVQKELKKLQKVLSTDYPECLEPVEDEDEEQRSSSEAVLKITLNFLRRMKQKDLAERLWSRTYSGVYRRKLKCELQQKCECVFEGIAKAGNPTLLKQIYTELYITEGGSSEVNQEHEVRHMETASRKPAETPITCEELFKGPADTHGPIRTVLTKGVAGIGKTVLTQKFSLDWAEGKANQDIQLLFPFTFRALNVMKDRSFSLVTLVHHFFSQTQAELCSFEDLQVLFIFDGLDECRLPLDFTKTKALTDPQSLSQWTCCW
ncbi:hypothetical protein WMY93_006828 [Mugilogobius chulae]|uniref:NACHT domain-containing protein n=1 Tax=Mugilogobius chulae TaxID=88201 RepID=A0AAW0PSB6_9GOBI